MAASETKPKPNERKPDKPRSRRTTVLLALLAVIVVLAIWLSNCIPGFGFGGAGEADGEASEQTAEGEAKTPPSEPAKPAEPPPTPTPEPAAAPVSKTLLVRIDVRGCSIADAPPSECASLCERAELFENIDDAIVQVDGASQASVVAMLDCLKSKQIDKVAIRREPTP
jgi:hypothetical protein